MLQAVLELLGGQPRPALEHDHLRAGGREVVRRDRAAEAGADDERRRSVSISRSRGIARRRRRRMHVAPARGGRRSRGSATGRPRPASGTGSSARPGCAGANRGGGVELSRGMEGEHRRAPASAYQSNWSTRFGSSNSSAQRGPMREGQRDERRHASGPRRTVVRERVAGARRCSSSATSAGSSGASPTSGSFIRSQTPACTAPGPAHAPAIARSAAERFSPGTMVSPHASRVTRSMFLGAPPVCASVISGSVATRRRRRVAGHDVARSAGRARRRSVRRRAG